MQRRAVQALLALTGALLASSAKAEPDATALLFDEPQLAATKPGDVLVYAYKRVSKDPAQFGPTFDDTVRLLISKGSGDALRHVEAELFTGTHRRPAGPFDDMTGNPLLSVMLEDNIQSMAAELGGNPRYFKNAVRTALREHATVVAETVAISGQMVPGWRITIAPFKDDPNKARMKGLDSVVYVFKVAQAVPGEIDQIDISAKGDAGDLLLEEKVTYVAAEN